MSSLLEYHKEMIKNILAEDSISILSVGIGLELVVLALIKIYQNPRNLVLILNSEKDDQNFILSHIEHKENIKIINSQMCIKKRMECYLSDGIVFLPSRIFIYDILVRKTHINFITGLLILNAENVLKKSHLQFALKIFRDKNTTAFIKSFSEHPNHFIGDFNDTQKIIKTLFAKNIFLWPRFHVSVSSVLRKQQIDVIEINISLTDHQIIIESSLVDLINQSCQNLLKSSSELMLYKNQFTIDNILSSNFFKKFQPLFSSLVNYDYCKPFIDDIKILKSLLTNLTDLNAFEFDGKLNAIKNLYKKNFLSPETTQAKGSWMLSNDAENLFIHSLERVSRISIKFNNSKNSLNENIIEELNPKWKVLLDIFDDVLTTKFDDFETPSQWEVLILTFSNARVGSFFKFKTDPYSFLGKKISQSSNIEKSHESPTTNTEFSDDEQVDDIKNSNDYSCSQSWSEKIIYQVITSYHHYFIQDNLNAFKPHFVIMYDISLEWIRMLELYKAINPKSPLRVYMIFHKNSIEEKIYLSSLNYEKEAFEMLIKEKAIMVLPSESNEGENDIDDELIADKVLGNIIVDVREFGSDLPLVLHKTGFHIEPITLEIGDYVLTHDIGIERKSIPDFVSSLNSGRLYHQSMALSRYYKNPFLLIEFNNSCVFKSGIFAKQSTLKSFSTTNSFYIQSKLILLVLHCSTLGLLWCPSPEYTAKLFLEIKQGKPEPDSDLASSLTSYELTDCINVETNKTHDFLVQLPAMNRINAKKISSKAKNFHQLAQLTKQEFVDILGEKGDKLYDLFNTPILISN